MIPSLRIEIFPADLDRTIEFYESIGFLLAKRTAGPPRYAYLVWGSVKIGAVESDYVDPATRLAPRGVEIVIDVDDVRAARERVTAAGIELIADLTEQPWGLTDFRFADPDGFYLRVTGRYR